MARYRYSVLKGDIYDLEGARIARAGDALTPNFMKSIRDKKRNKALDSKPIFNDREMRDNLVGLLQSEPYRIIFDSPKVIDQTLQWMERVTASRAVFESLHFFKTNEPYTYRHILLVSALTTRMAKRLIPSPKKLLEELSLDPLHDFGKITIPLDILNKSSRLTVREREILKDHSAAGFVLLNYYLGDGERLGPKVAHEHHERRDGSGYPRGIKLVDKMVELVAVCDVFDALISDRPYRDSPYDTRTALELICEQAEFGKLSWEMVKLLISYNRRDRPFYKECIISTEKRGIPPRENRYCLTVDDTI